MLKVTNIRKAFKDNEVLKGVDIEVNKGDVVTILGPSGSGKTTLLRCINFLEQADGGQLDFDEQNLTVVTNMMMQCMMSTSMCCCCCAKKRMC